VFSSCACTGKFDFFSTPTGAYILENTPPRGGGGAIPANVIWGKKYEKTKRKRGKCKVKGRKGKENEKRGAKRVK
jgi:hypothetical protein